jgi:hypothetical protein
MSRVKDPGLLRELHAIWDEWGCACCGLNPGPSAPPGIALELAHVVRRSQGGPDTADNILGLCPDHHHAYDLYRLAIKRNDRGVLVWLDSSPGGLVYQPCRIPPEVVEMIAATNGDAGGWNVSHETVEPEAEVVSDEPPPVLDQEITGAALSVSHTGDPVPAAAPVDLYEPSGPEERYARLTFLLKRSRHDRLLATLHLHEAWKRQEWEQLGTTWPDYYDGLGLEKSTVSKMLRVGQVFSDLWRGLPEADQALLSVERLYLAARLADRDQLTPSAALAEAVANPTSQLVAQLKGDEPADRCEHHECPNCGGSIWHNRKGS